MDIAWAAGFRMHRRLVRRLAAGRSFLLGDAGHLSSPFGGEGRNQGCTTVIPSREARARAARPRPPGRCSRATAPSGWSRIATCSRSPTICTSSPVASSSPRAAARRPRSLRRRSRRRSCGRGRCWRRQLRRNLAGGRAPGRRQLGGRRSGTRRALPRSGPHSRARRTTCLVSGDADERALESFRRRWNGLVEVGRAPASDGASGSSALLVRPDGYLGYRSAPADAVGLGALDGHLDSYPSCRIRARPGTSGRAGPSRPDRRRSRARRSCRP